MLAQEARVLGVVMQESVVQSSQYLRHSAVEVKMRLDTQNELLRTLETAADWESGRAT